MLDCSPMNMPGSSCTNQFNLIIRILRIIMCFENLIQVELDNNTGDNRDNLSASAGQSLTFKHYGPFILKEIGQKVNHDNMFMPIPVNSIRKMRDLRLNSDLHVRPRPLEGVPDFKIYVA